MADYKRSVKDIVHHLVQRGWRVRQGRNCHYIAYSPNKKYPPVAFAATPSDWRGVRNNVALLNKYGANIKTYG